MSFTKSHAVKRLYQPGNQLQLQWSGRLESHLGRFKADMERPYAAFFMHSPTKLISLNTLTVLLRQILAEHDPQPLLFHATSHLLESMMTEEEWRFEYLKFEQLLLDEMGYGLDLERCAATGSDQDLYYISPKTGRAVSKQAGAAYHDRLFKFPQCFVSDQKREKSNDTEIIEGLTITGFFLEKYLKQELSASLPECRRQLLKLVGD